MAEPNTMDTLMDICAVAMALVSVGIVSVGAIRRMIQLYQIQSLLLASLTFLAAIRYAREGLQNTAWVLAAFALAIPALLAYVIEPLLAQATVPHEDVRWLRRLGLPFLRLFSANYRAQAQRAIREALPVWLEHSLSQRRQVIALAVSLSLIATAYTVALSLPPGIAPERAGSLAVALALMLLGIFTMISREDLISQIMGLLVMDHGLFLAVVRVIKYPSLVPIFVISLILYILITLVILVILLPELHAASRTIEVADQNKLQG